MAKVQITNGKKEAIVTDDGSLTVSVTPYPTKSSQLTSPFRLYFTLDGTADGDNDMGQDGSVNNLEFFIPANNSADMYITHVNLITGYGASAQPFQFGDGAALSNGIEFSHQSKYGKVFIQESIKSNQDFFRLADGNFSTAWELRGIGSTNDYGYFTDINMDQFAPYFGVKLDASTNQKMSFIIKDSMTAVSAASDSFNAIAHGFYRFDK